MTIKPGDKKRKVPTLPHQRHLNPMLSSRQLILHLILVARVPGRTTSFKVLDHVGVAVCGPDGFTSVSEGGVGEKVTPGGNKGV
jgi:hypothetical protein